MNKMTGMLIGLCLLAGAALADQTSVEALTGGGAISQGGGLTLDGAIAGAGLSGDNAGLSQGGGFLLGVGYYPVLLGQIFAENFADPAWLELGRALAPAGAGMRGLGSLLLLMQPRGAEV